LARKSQEGFAASQLNTPAYGSHSQGLLVSLIGDSGKCPAPDISARTLARHRLGRAELSNKPHADPLGEMQTE